MIMTLLICRDCLIVFEKEISKCIRQLLTFSYHLHPQKRELKVYRNSTEIKLRLWTKQYLVQTEGRGVQSRGGWMSLETSLVSVLEPGGRPVRMSTTWWRFWPRQGSSSKSCRRADLMVGLTRSWLWLWHRLGDSCLSQQSRHRWDASWVGYIKWALAINSLPRRGSGQSCRTRKWKERGTLNGYGR